VGDVVEGGGGHCLLRFENWGWALGERCSLWVYGDWTVVDVVVEVCRW